MLFLRTLIYFAAIFVAQTTVFARVEIFGGHLDALLASVIAWGLIGGVGWGVFTGAFAGYFTDLFSSASHIVYLPAMALAGFLSGVLRKNVYRERYIVIAFCVFLTSIFAYSFSNLILLWFYGKEIQNFWAPMFFSSLLNALFAPIAAKAAEKIGGDG